MTAETFGFQTLTLQDRVVRLETKQAQDDEDIAMLTNLVERMVRVEERQVGLSRIVWTGITLVGTLQAGIVLYLVQSVLV